jgi:hypothetical protein
MLLPKLFPGSEPDHRAEIESKLIHYEAKIGGQLFGPVPEGHQRQFFCLDENTWIWHESWLDNSGNRQSVTTRYDVRPNGVLKLQNGKVYQRLSRDEARNLYKTTQLYAQRVSAEYQRMLQTA